MCMIYSTGYNMFESSEGLVVQAGVMVALVTLIGTKYL